MSGHPTSNETRRRLQFESLEEVAREVRRLMPAHRTLRRWTLGQICRHLADTLHGSIDGFDPKNHRIKRLFLRRWLWKYTLRWGIPENYTVDPSLNPPAGLQLNAEAARLEEAIRRYRQHTGPLRFHPLFGTLSRPDWDWLHMIHAAHHLGFVLPTEPYACGRPRRDG